MAAVPTGESIKFASRNAQQCCDVLRTDPAFGLSASEVCIRRAKCGPNELVLAAGETLFEKFLGQFKDPLILLLLASAFMSLLVGQISDAVSIALTILIVLTVAFVQEYKSLQSLEALNKLAPPHCHVIRYP